MRLSYKYRIYPNQQQTEKLEEVFGFCRFLYNSALEERIGHYRKYKEILALNDQCKKFVKMKSSVSYCDQAKELIEIKAIFKEEISPIYSQTLQSVLKTLDTAYENFFRKIKLGLKKPGFPRFKGKNRFKSILFPQSDLTGFGVKRLENNKIQVYGIPGEIKVKWHRQYEGNVKTVAIKKDNDKYYLIVSCDNVPLKALPKTGKIIAIDLGLKDFITTDDGMKFHHPKPYKTAKEKLAFLNRKLALKKRGSNNRTKAKRSLVRAYEKISNIRDDFQHKLANKIIRENDVIIIEKLDIVSMLEQENSKVDKSNIQDASWGSFAAKLTYKAERAGKKIIEVEPANTSKMCSDCRNIKENLTLADREYKCEACGLALDRDHNAALNIYRLGMSLAVGVKSTSEAPSFRTG